MGNLLGRISYWLLGDSVGCWIHLKQYIIVSTISTDACTMNTAVLNCPTELANIHHPSNYTL